LYDELKHAYSLYLSLITFFFNFLAGGNLAAAYDIH